MSGALVAAGLVTGLLVGMTGVGAGSLMAPMLLFLGINPAVVVGSDLLYGSITKTVGTWQHFRRGSVNIGWVVRLALGSVPGVLAGSVLVHRVGAVLGPASGDVIKLVLGVVLAVTASVGIVRELLRLRVDRRRRPGLAAGDGAAEPAGRETPGWVPPLLGAAIGLLAGFTSAGSGPLVALVLLICSPLAARHVVGTDLAHGILLFGAGALAHWRLGSVDVALTLNLLLGSIPGVLLGSRLAYRAPGPALRLTVNAAVMVAGIFLAQAAAGA